MNFCYLSKDSKVPSYSYFINRGNIDLSISDKLYCFTVKFLFNVPFLGYGKEIFSEFQEKGYSLFLSVNILTYLGLPNDASNFDKLPSRSFSAI